MAEKAVYYARVSTEEEKQLNALEKQCTDLEHCIKSNGWTLVEKYIDEGKSGTSVKKRNEYSRLYDDMETDKFDVIVIKSQDRLMRNVKDWYIFIDKLVTNHKKLFLYMENTFYKTDDSLLTGIKAILAAEYSRDLSKKLNNAHKRREKEGSSVMTNGTMIGYDQCNGELVINEKEAELVKKVFNLYIDGNGIKTVAKILDEQGYRNAKWNRYCVSTITRMLKNEKYIGTMICNKTHKDFDTKKVIQNDKSEWIIHENRLPVIISKEVFYKAQDIMKKNTLRKQDGTLSGKRVGHDVLFGKIFCGECDSPMGVYSTTRKNGSVSKKCCCRNFMVNGRKGIGMDKDLGCELLNVSYDKLKESIIDITEKIKIDYESILSISNESNSMSKAKDELNLCIKNITDNSAKREKLLDAFLDGVIAEDIYKIKSEKLESELDTLKNNREILESKIVSDNTKKNDIDEVVAKIKENDIDYNSFCQLIDKIVFFNDCSFVYLYSIPTPIKIEDNLHYNRKNSGENWVKINGNRHFKSDRHRTQL